MKDEYDFVIASDCGQPCYDSVCGHIFNNLFATAFPPAFALVGYCKFRGNGWFLPTCIIILYLCFCQLLELVISELNFGDYYIIV